MTGVVEVDETYWGAEDQGLRGRQTERKALIAVAAEERGSGLGRIRMTARAERRGGQFDALRRGVGRARPSVVRTDGWLGYEPLAEEGLPALHRLAKGSPVSRRRNCCRWCTRRFRCSSAYGRAGNPPRGGQPRRTWTTIWTSSCSVSTGAAHAAAAISSTGWSQQDVRAVDPTPYRSIVAELGTPGNPVSRNHKILGSPE